MIDSPFREKLPRYVKPLIRFYNLLGLTPNSVTLLALGFAFAASYLTSQGYELIAIAVWWIGRLLDGTDGIYARQTLQSSSFGAFLDIVCDMTSYSIMILGFDHCYPELHSLWLLILLLYVLCITSALAMGNLEVQNKLQNSSKKKDNRGLRLASGIAEGGETGIAYTLFLLFPSQIFWLVSTWIVILALTVFSRTLLVYLESKS